MILYHPCLSDRFVYVTFAGVAQLVEQLICNQQVGGSSPSTSSTKLNMGVFPSGQRGQTVNLLSLTSVVRIHPLPPNKKDLPLASLFCLVGAGGFEPPKAVPTDLQSAPFGHSGTLPHIHYSIENKNGAGGRTRTPDLLITNQLLYQLSYTSVSTLDYYITNVLVCQAFF